MVVIDVKADLRVGRPTANRTTPALRQQHCVVAAESHTEPPPEIAPTIVHRLPTGTAVLVQPVFDALGMIAIPLFRSFAGWPGIPRMPFCARARVARDAVV